MTKTTMKQRKRRNQKLKRTIRKTVAAIIMIMAVIVAAIPVENLGTMQAKTTAREGVDLDKLYEAYKYDIVINKEVSDAGNYKRKTEYYSSNDSASDYQIISVEGNTLQRQFFVDKREDGKSGVIVGYAGRGGDVIISDKELPTGYFTINASYKAAVEEILKSETYAVEFDKNAPEEYNLDVDGDGDGDSDYTITIPATIDLNNQTYLDNGRSIQSSITVSEWNSETKGVIQKTYNFKDGLDAGLGMSDKDIFATYATVKYDEKVTDLTKYNNAVKELIAEIEAASEITDGMARNWQTQANSLKTTYKYPECKSLEIQYPGGIDSNEQEKFLKDSITKRFTGYLGCDLKNFSLLKLDADKTLDEYTGNDAGEIRSVYIPVYNKSGAKPSIELSPEGYIMTGSILITGIGKQAFMDTPENLNVKLSTQVEFIGNEAFLKCDGLKSIDLAYCKVIGNRAFKDCTYLNTVTFGNESGEPTKSGILGSEAFFNCQGLKTVSFPRAMSIIGRGCFAKSGLNSFYVSEILSGWSLTIYPFAFYNCKDLGNGVDATKFFTDITGYTVKIGLGAFALPSGSSGNMDSFAFPNGLEKIIAGEDDIFEIESALNAVKIPKSGNTEGEVYYDYILAGRRGLREIKFPASLRDTKIPDNTLMGCSGLEKAIFGECAYKEERICEGVWFDAEDLPNGTKFDKDEDGETLFSDVTNTLFGIEGPGYEKDGVTPSSVRVCAGAVQTVNSNFVPYKYLNEKGGVQFEMSYGENGEYLAIVVVNPDGETATLREFKNTDKTSKTDIPQLVVPQQIGGYRITALGEECFKEIKDKIYELVISDGTVAKIEKEALTGATKLRSVSLGNSVNFIGEGAFRNCPELENVHFTNPIQNNEGWEKALTIEKDAFKTGSRYLTFHGEIHSGYAPFEYAMDPSNQILKSGRNICYKTPAPSNLMVIRDNADDARTLVDYPHYNEIDLMNEEYRKKMESTTGIHDYSIIDKFEDAQGWINDPAYDGEILTDMETQLVLSTLSIQIPDGVTSVDGKEYYKNNTGSNSNADNFDYLTRVYERVEKAPYIEAKTIKRQINDGTDYNDVVRLYSEDGYTANKTRGYASDTATAGLFSGYFYDDKNQESFIGHKFTFAGNSDLNGQEYTEGETEGNDLLTHVGLGSSKILPDYAFRSCENLLSVSLGDTMYDMGKAPFRGCSKLTGIVGNSRFFSENAIIYENTADMATDTGEEFNEAAPYRIVECLETRGTNMVIASSIHEKEDKNLSKVGEVEEEAFAYCDFITGVDLTASKIAKIPDNCFKSSEKLNSVMLPETVKYIGIDAFDETTTDVWIYSRDCVINNSFGDNYKGDIYGYRYKDDANTEDSDIYIYCKENGLEKNFHEIGYFITFVSEGATIATLSVDEGGSVTPPEAPEKVGFKFVGWEWKTTDEKGNEKIVTGAEAYQNVHENRRLVAKYDIGFGVVSDGNPYKLKITGGKDMNGNSNFDSIMGGTPVYLVADVSDGKPFQYWTAVGSKKNADGKMETVDCSHLLGDIHSAKTSFIMDNMDIEITAHFTTMENGNGNGTGNGSSGSGSGNGSGSGTGTETKYKVTVNYGSGSGDYKAGDVVTINAYAASSSNKEFSRWTSTNTSVGFANATSTSTSFVMPAAAVTVTANYKTRTADDDDDSELEALNKRKPTSTTTTVTTGTNNATVTTTTGTVTNATTTATTPTGDSITINKGGISNTGVASTQVEGAADNFVVKVTDSTDAVTQAEEALKNKYGSLDGILYFPMDISLYDVTGKNLITDTTGLDVNVTLPIPDELIQYGGNVRVAAIENGQIEDLNVRFTTIDGIACMSFVAPHFSPYVVYVDTNNLVAGQMLDATPKTGDPIHPKWFLAMGMACLSVILFTTGDKKEKIKMA